MSSGAARAAGPRAALRYSLMGLASIGLALAAALGAAGGSLAAEPLVVTVGDREGTAAVQAFLPGAVTVTTGSTVTFRVGSDVPHGVAIGDGPDGIPPSEWPVSGWPEPDVAEVPGGSPAPIDLGEVFYGDSGFVNSGVLPEGATASVTFQVAGEYQVFCPDHQNMVATVTVVDPGTAKVTSQADADAAAAASRDALLGQADTLREARAADVESFTASDGTTTWNVFADAATVATDLPGGGVGYLELFEFVPSTLSIAPGDTVHWSAVGVTSVTFPATGQDPATLDPTAPATADETFDGKRLANSGLLNAATGSPSAYTLTFPTAGSYTFVSLPHLAFGQEGTVVVGEAGSPGASAAP